MIRQVFMWETSANGFRNVLRKATMNGDVPGVRKASW